MRRGASLEAKKCRVCVSLFKDAILYAPIVVVESIEEERLCDDDDDGDADDDDDRIDAPDSIGEEEREEGKQY